MFLFEYANIHNFLYIPTIICIKYIELLSKKVTGTMITHYACLKMYEKLSRFIFVA